MDNAERGAFAEYLVACAIDGKGNGRVNWDKYDLTSKEGITVEIKTSAYIQTWGQDRLSTIRLGIAETKGYDSETNTYEIDKKRQAQVYVFCIHYEIDQDNVNPLDTRQWDFYVLASKIINGNKDYSKASSISLNPLIKWGAFKSKFEGLPLVIIEAVKV